MNRRFRAYMSGALTNITTAWRIPPCCKVDSEELAQFEGEIKNRELKVIGEQLKKQIKEHYERIKSEVCRPLNVSLYLPHKHSDPDHNADLEAETVHNIDRLKVTDSDFLIVCADIPSLGVGQELEIATQAGIPAIAYKHKTTRTSRMFLGNPILCDDIHEGTSPESASERIIEYETEENLFTQLRHRITLLTSHLEKRIPPVFRKDRRGLNTFAERLDHLAEKSPYNTHRKLAGAMGVPAIFAAHLRKTPDILKQTLDCETQQMGRDFESMLGRGYNFDNFSNPTLSTLRQLATILNTTVAELAGETDQDITGLVGTVMDLCEEHFPNMTIPEFRSISRDVPRGISHRDLREFIASRLEKLRAKKSG